MATISSTDIGWKPPRKKTQFTNNNKENERLSPYGEKYNKKAQNEHEQFSARRLKLKRDWIEFMQSQKKENKLKVMLLN